MKLKTLKDIEETSSWDATLDCYCHIKHAEQLRQEAIKHYKDIQEYIKKDGCHRTRIKEGMDRTCKWIKWFFNITEEELK